MIDASSPEDTEGMVQGNAAQQPPLTFRFVGVSFVAGSGPALATSSV